MGDAEKRHSLDAHGRAVRRHGESVWIRLSERQPRRVLTPARIADGTVHADGELIYQVKNMKVALSES